MECDITSTMSVIGTSKCSQTRAEEVETPGYDYYLTHTFRVVDFKQTREHQTYILWRDK